MPVQTECSKVHTKTTKGQYSSVWLEPEMLVSRFLENNCFTLNFLVFEKKIIHNLSVSVELSNWQNTNQIRTNQNT